MTHPTGVRRVLNRAAGSALAAGPPTRAQEVTYTVAWVATTLTACALLALARWLSR